MKKARRKFEELAWVLGLHGTMVKIHRAVGKRENSSALRAFYARMLPPNALAFDIGANTGLYSEALESAGAVVIAVEPNADCARHIELTYRNRRIETVHAAVGSQNGLATFNISDLRDDTSTMSNDWIKMLQKAYNHDPAQWKKVTVPIITLDTLREHYGPPDYIKIDVEGYESSVLDGLSVQPPLLSFEYHGANLNGAIECLRNPIFSKCSVFNLTNESGNQFQFAEWVGLEEIERALNSIAGTLTYRDLYVMLDENKPAR